MSRAWRKHSGGGQPRESSGFVDVEFRDGGLGSYPDAESLGGWEHDGSEHDVIAWRNRQASTPAAATKCQRCGGDGEYCLGGHSAHPSNWRKCEDCTPAAVAPEQVTDYALREAVATALAEALGDAMDCMRVWDAWRVGTMTQDDFAIIRDDDCRLHELADAAIAAIAAQQKGGRQ